METPGGRAAAPGPRRPHTHPRRPPGGEPARWRRARTHRLSASVCRAAAQHLPDAATLWPQALAPRRNAPRLLPGSRSSRRQKIIRGTYFETLTMPRMPSSSAVICRRRALEGALRRPRASSVALSRRRRRRRPSSVVVGRRCRPSSFSIIAPTVALGSPESIAVRRHPSSVIRRRCSASGVVGRPWVGCHPS